MRKFGLGSHADKGIVRSRFRTAGDQARNKRQWSAAIEYYRRHLLLAPEDAAIWVQLGHSLKETGANRDAVCAYRTALEIRADDADLLLHLGNASIASGDLETGIEYLRRSAAAGGVHAIHDLGAMGVPAAVVSRAPNESESAALLAAITRGCKGLRATNYSALRLLPNGDIQSLSNDPWIEFQLDRADRAATMALLTIEAVPRNDELRLLAQLYADLGDGFDERQSTRFMLPEGVAHVILVEPSKMARIRWDPDQAENIIAPPRLRIEPIADKTEAERVIRAHAPDDADLDTLIELLEDVLSGERKKQKKPRPLRPVIGLGFELARSIEFSHDYEYWLLRNQAPSAVDYKTMSDMQNDFAIKPKFSFVMPTYNTPIALLRECMDSLLAQTYSDFEVCVADDNSPNHEVAATLREYAAKDTRVKICERPYNGHISEASNSAIALASGDFIVLVDHDDLIPDYALFTVAWYINQNPKADILFSDEDKVSVNGSRLQPYFKSEFNKYLLYGHNMISHLGIYRKSLIDEVGGFRLGLEGSQDYDLFLRCYERTQDDRVIHIPHILYHWRIIPGSTAMSADQKSYAVVAAQHSINGHFERTGVPLRSVEGFAPGCTAVKPTIVLDTPLSIIIPTRNGLDLLRPCIDSILARPHENAEIIIVDNDSDEPATLKYLESLKRSGLAQILPHPGEFNFSTINNIAAQHAKGEILCFLNNDTEIISKDWINRARVFLSLKEIGAVGARLLYPDGMLQHFGIALGMGEHKIAGIPHAGMDANLPGYFGKARLLQEVSAATAACLFVRKSDFEAIDGFDSDLRVAYNDVDLCLKIRARGLKILADPDITLIHKESRTRGSDKYGARAKRLDEEAAWMRERWAHQLDNDPYFSPNLDLGRLDFAYASRPRAPWPWERARVAEVVRPTANQAA